MFNIAYKLELLLTAARPLYLSKKTINGEGPCFISLEGRPGGRLFRTILSLFGMAPAPQKVEVYRNRIEYGVDSLWFKEKDRIEFSSVCSSGYQFFRCFLFLLLFWICLFYGGVTMYNAANGGSDQTEQAVSNDGYDLEDLEDEYGLEGMEDGYGRDAMKSNKDGVPTGQLIWGAILLLSGFLFLFLYRKVQCYVIYVYTNCGKGILFAFQPRNSFVIPPGDAVDVSFDEIASMMDYLNALIDAGKASYLPAGSASKPVPASAFPAPGGIAPDQAHPVCDGAGGNSEAASLMRMEQEEVKKLADRYPPDNPFLCQAFLDAVSELGLKTSAAGEYVRTANENMIWQKDCLERIQKRYGLPQNKATLLLTGYSALSRSSLPGMKMFDVAGASGDPVARKGGKTGPFSEPMPDFMKQTFKIPDHDIVLGGIDLFKEWNLRSSKRKGGLLFSRDGIYARYEDDRQQVLIGAAVMGTAFLICCIVIALLSSSDGDSISVVGVVGVSLLLSPWIPIVFLLLFRHWIRKTTFTQWMDVSISRSRNGKKMRIGRRTVIRLPGEYRSSNAFELLKKQIERQREIAS